MLSQCAVEEATELKLGMLGLTTYAETISVYGTETVFIDGDDTPYSKTFLAAAYASRGMKMRCTSGSGSEALMGHAEKKSMLYLEARCLLMIKGGGVQGTQNGSDQLHRPGGRGAFRHPGGACGEPAGRHARPGGRLRQ